MPPKCSSHNSRFRKSCAISVIFLLIFSSTFIIMYLCITSFQLEEANVYKEVKQFTYKDGSQFVFMDLVYKLYIYAYDLVVINTFLKFLIT